MIFVIGNNCDMQTHSDAYIRSLQIISLIGDSGFESEIYLIQHILPTLSTPI